MQCFFSFFSPMAFVRRVIKRLTYLLTYIAKISYKNVQKCHVMARHGLAKSNIQSCRISWKIRQKISRMCSENCINIMRLLLECRSLTGKLFFCVTLYRAIYIVLAEGAAVMCVSRCMLECWWVVVTQRESSRRAVYAPTHKANFIDYSLQKNGRHNINNNKNCTIRKLILLN